MSKTSLYMVLVEAGKVTKAAVTDVERPEALRVARQLRAAGEHVYVMRLDRECSVCVCKADEPLPEA